MKFPRRWNAPVEAFFAHLNTQKKAADTTKKYPGIFPTRLSLWLLPGWPKQHAERFSSQNRSCKWRQRQPVSGFSLYERQGLGASLCLWKYVFRNHRIPPYPDKPEYVPTVTPRWNTSWLQFLKTSATPRLKWRCFPVYPSVPSCPAHWKCCSVRHFLPQMTHWWKTCWSTAMISAN